MCKSKKSKAEDLFKRTDPNNPDLDEDIYVSPAMSLSEQKEDPVFTAIGYFSQFASKGVKIHLLEKINYPGFGFGENTKSNSNVGIKDLEKFYDLLAIDSAYDGDILTAILLDFAETNFNTIKNEYPVITEWIIYLKHGVNQKKQQLEEKKWHSKIFTEIKGYKLWVLLERTIDREAKTLAYTSFYFRKLHDEGFIHEHISERNFNVFISEFYDINVGKLKTLVHCTSKAKLELYNSKKKQLT